MVLYKVLGELDYLIVGDNLHYSIDWDSGIRAEFQLRNGQTEVSLNSYSYSYTYADSKDVSWIYAGRERGSLTDEVSFYIRGDDQYKQKVLVSISFVAAYGGNAPSQVVRVNTSKTFARANIRGGQPATLNLILEMNEKVELNPLLPCRSPSNWAPEDKDWHKFCYGIRDIKVRAIP